MRVAGLFVVLWIGLASLSLAEEVAKPSEKSSLGTSAINLTHSAEDDFELYQIFIDTLDQVERNYVKDVSRRELVEAAIEGVLTKLDPYSSYIGREDLGKFTTTMTSQFGGIGIQVGMKDGRLTVISPLVDTPAYRAGILAGDQIIEIDGKPTEGIPLDEAVKRLKGEVGSNVILSVIHPGKQEKQPITITREVIHVETVLGDRRKADDSWDYMLDHDKRIGYIRITAFSRDTAEVLKQALTELQKEDPKGLILDLRFNPGGLLTSAIEVADLFLPDGRIVSTQGRNTPERTWDAVKPGTFEGFPMVVLVNKYSASASEIVSASLQDHHRAVIIGERTWGKGSVQNVIELEGGKSALKLTTASYRRPNGHNIHRFPDSKDTDEWGVSPNQGMEVKLSDSELVKLLESRHDRDIVKAHESAPQTAGKPASADKPAVEASAVDRQLQKALDYLSQELAQKSK